MRQASSRILAFIAPRLSALLILLVVVGFGSSEWWISDLLANLRVHIVFAHLVFLTLLICYRLWRLAAVNCIVVTLGTVSIGFAIVDEPRTVDSIGQSIEISSLNLGSWRGQDAEIGELLDNQTADTLVLLEYSHEWHRSLEPLAAQYPFSVVEPRDGPFGIALFSRLSLRDVSIREFEDSGLPYITAVVESGTFVFRLFAVHLQWPVLPRTFDTRNQQIVFLSEIASKETLPTMMCGDFNLTPWSGWYRRLLTSGLDDGHDHNRLLATWPAVLGALGIPIDHCLANAELSIRHKRTGHSFGSDHRMITVNVATAP